MEKWPRVLIVDDSRLTIEIVQHALVTQEFEVESASDALEGLRMVASFRPDLILMDIRMPGMDGLELTRLLKADTASRHIVVVAFTAGAKRGDRAKFLAAGCDAYLSKAVNMYRLGDQVRACLARFEVPRGDPRPFERIASRPRAVSQADMRSLSPAAKRAKRMRVIELRAAGTSYARIAETIGLSRTGVFEICARYKSIGTMALRDAPSGRRVGDGRRLVPAQEALLCQLIVTHRPDELSLPLALWTRGAVGDLIEQRLGLQMPVRTLGAYLARWGFAATLPLPRRPGQVPPAVQRWLVDEYPGIEAQSRAQDGEIGWAEYHALPGHRPFSMISSRTNKGHMRWQTLAGELDATTLIEFLRRLIHGANKRLLLIMDGLHVSDARAVEHWLLVHEESIQVFHLPATADAPGLLRVDPADSG